MIVRINSTEEMRDYGERFGGLVSISTAARLASVSESRIYALVDRYRRFTDVRLFGQRMLNTWEVLNWIDDRDLMRRMRIAEGLVDSQRPSVVRYRYNSA
jgi:hypothetical protein